MVDIKSETPNKSKAYWSIAGEALAATVVFVMFLSLPELLALAKGDASLIWLTPLSFIPPLLYLNWRLGDHCYWSAAKMLKMDCDPLFGFPSGYPPCAGGVLVGGDLCIHHDTNSNWLKENCRKDRSEHITLIRAASEDSPVWRPYDAPSEFKSLRFTSQAFLLR